MREKIEGKGEIEDGRRGVHTWELKRGGEWGMRAAGERGAQTQM